MAGAIIGKGGHNIQKLRTEVCFDTILISEMIFRSFRYSYLFRQKPPQSPLLAIPLKYPNIIPLMKTITFWKFILIFWYIKSGKFRFFENLKEKFEFFLNS